MKWILILTLITPSGTTVDSVPEFVTPYACQRAGQLWIDTTKKLKGPVDALFVCVEKGGRN